MIDGHNTERLPDYAALNRAWVESVKPALIDGFYHGQLGLVRWLAREAWRVHCWARKLGYKMAREHEALPPNRAPPKMERWG